MVTRAELLEQLSALVGVEVLDVHRSPARAGTHGVPRWHPSFRPPEPGSWWVTVVLPTIRGVRPAMTPLGPNGGVRNPKRLNRWATRIGRSPDASPLTAEDGHAALRLLYAITETKEAPCRQT
jgi:hypothetical protein